MLSSLKSLFTPAEKATLTQQRRHRRSSCYVPVLCTLGKQTEPAVVLDYSESGLKLLVRQKARVGDTLQLHYRRDESDTNSPAVAAKVVWSRANGAFQEVGVTCNQQQIFWVPYLMKALEAGQDSVDRRLTVRLGVEIPVTIVARLGPNGTTSSVKARLVNLSLGGACIEAFTTVPIGEAVQVEFEHPSSGDLTLAGLIVQARPDEGHTTHGVRFQSPSGPERQKLMKLLNALNQPARKKPARPAKAARPAPTPKPSNEPLGWLFDE